MLVSAPAGYGKSTVLGTWVRQMEGLTAWLSLDEADNDPMRFLTYLAKALTKIEPSLGEDLEASLQAVQVAEFDLLLTPWINQLNQVEHPFWLVLDDYHVIQNQAIHQMVNFLLEHRPEPFHLAIATRADPPLPISRLRGRALIVELRSADLRFSVPEIAEFLWQGMGLELSAEDLAMLETSTEGWIAGIQMAGLSLQGREDVSGFIHSFSGDNRYILDFLFDEVFQHQSEDLQNFLLQTSILDRLCAPLCNAVTGRKNSGDILDMLERSNLFLIALDEQRKWYRYHHLFTSLLKNRLRQAPVSMNVLLNQRASAWYAAQNELDNAITHSLAAEDYAQAAWLIEQVNPSLDLVNQQAQLIAWVDRLPREILSSHPWLCAYRAYGHYWTGRREMAEEWLQLAEESSRVRFESGSAEIQHILGYIAAVRTHTALVNEDIARTKELAQQALNWLPEGDIMRCSAAIALGVVYWALGDVKQSEQTFEIARSAARKVRNSSTVSPLCYLGIQQMKQGLLQDAQAAFAQGLRLATLPDGTETSIAGFPNIRLGDLFRQRNELALASLHLTQGVEQCIRLEQVDFLTDAYICLGRCQLALGKPADASASIHKAEQVAKQARVDQWVLCWLDDLRVRTWLATGNLEAATRWAKHSGLSPDQPLSYLHDLHHMNLARVLVAQGVLSGWRSSHKQADALLARLQDAAEKAGWVHELIHIQVLQAVNQHAFGNSSSALQSLARAVTLAEPGGYVRVFLDEGEIIQNLLVDLAHAIQNGHLAELYLPEQKTVQIQEYVSRLLSNCPYPIDAPRAKPPFAMAIGQKPSASPAALIQDQALVERLSLREMDVLNLLAQGYSDKKIAETLTIARGTVHKHLKNIYGKLDAHSRTEAVACARHLGLL